MIDHYNIGAYIRLLAEKYPVIAYGFLRCLDTAPLTNPTHHAASEQLSTVPPDP